MKKEYVLIEAVGTFRMRYMVEVPEGKSAWAGDAVVLSEAKEFSQQYLGEQIISQRVLTEKEVLELCDEDNSYAKSWADEKKMSAFVTQWTDEDGSEPSL